MKVLFSYITPKKETIFEFYQTSTVNKDNLQWGYYSIKVFWEVLYQKMYVPDSKLFWLVSALKDYRYLFIKDTKWSFNQDVFNELVWKCLKSDQEQNDNFDSTQFFFEDFDEYTDYFKITFTLWDLIRQLEELPQHESIVDLHYPHSYRGDYSQLWVTLNWAKTSIGQLLNFFKLECLDKTFEWYKWGSFTMKKDKEIYLSEYWECSYIKIIGVMKKYNWEYQLVCWNEWECETETY